ncbi:MAG: hypothetical protein WC129_02430 [Sphaerochaetaceae bacterium]|jgi:hypothetical protein|nr:hypothetical protein [Sphaerochaetaceae bacterium]MDX9809716.1 hypothetical protein [Sphaerochaetaceae bacterium]NLV83416.1 hypothetical protein [Spirochaetales bacterium]
MVRRSTVLLVCLVSLVFLTFGCATTVSVRHLVPAQIDMSSHRGIAVTSTEPYLFGFFNRPASVVKDYTGKSGYRISSGFGAFTEDSVARHVTNTLVSALEGTDYFHILPPSQTDTIVKGKNLGYSTSDLLVRNSMDALFSTSIEYLGIDEYIYAVDKKVTLTHDPVTGVQLPTPVVQIVQVYYLKQKVTLTFRYEIADVRTGKIITSRSQNSEYEQSIDLTQKPKTGYFAPSLEPVINDMLDEIVRPLVKKIAPRWETTTLSLMSNKPERPSIEYAWEEVRRGNLFIALEAFEEEWQRSRHIPSGYNAALVMEAMAQTVEDLQKAIDLMQKVYQASGNSKIYTTLRTMRQRLEDQRLAESQIMGTSW